MRPQGFASFGFGGTAPHEDLGWNDMGHDPAPQPLSAEVKENLDQLHVQSFLNAIRTGKQPNANLQVGVNGAMTAILGRDAIYRKALLRWSDLGVLL